MVALNTYADLAGTGNVKADRVTLNSNFEAIMALHYSDDGTAPPVTKQGLLWADAQAGYLKQRNESDSAWYVIGKLFASGDPGHLGVLSTVVTKGTEAADVIRFTVQARDASGAVDQAGRRHVLIVVSASSFGAPGGTQTVTFNTGTILVTHTANQIYLVESDATGMIEVDVNVSGAGSRYVRASVGDSEPVELDGTWAA